MSYDFNILFQFQYYLESLNSYYLNNFNYLTVLILVLLGGLSGINPCILSLMPIYNAYISIGKEKNQQEYKFFIAGIYTGIVVVVSLSAKIYNSRLYNQYGSWLIGLLILLLGGQQLRITNLNNRLPIQKFLNYVKTYENVIPGKYLVGILLGLMGASCSTPSIVTLSLWLRNTKEVYLGLVFIGIYSAGYIMPIIFFNFIFDKIHYNLKKILFGEWFKIIGGNILITIGTYYILFLFD